MPAVEWDLWCHFYGVEPFGPRQEELRAGTIAAVAGNAWGGKLMPADLFPSLGGTGKGDGGRGWRAWARSRCPALSAVRPGSAGAPAGGQRGGGPKGRGAGRGRRN
jgi:hypothetical protein